MDEREEKVFAYVIEQDNKHGIFYFSVDGRFVSMLNGEIPANVYFDREKAEKAMNEIKDSKYNPFRYPLKVITIKYNLWNGELEFF